MRPISCTTSIRTSKRPGVRQSVLVTAALALVLGALAACGRQPAAAVAPSGDTAVDVAGLVAVMLAPPGPDAQQRFLDRLPAPRATSVARLVNRHDPRVDDSIETMRYDGVTVEVYHAGASGRSIPMSVRVETALDPVEGLQVGMTEAAIHAVLGVPDERSDDAMRYRVFDDPTTAPYEIVIGLDGGRTSSVTWRAYLD